MIILILKLLLAHIIGDFVLQPNKWVKEKQNKKIKSAYLYAHIGVHAAALLLLFKFEKNYITTILISCLCHYLIDLGKLYLLPKTIHKKILFTTDQLLHILIIGGIAIYRYPIEWRLSDEITTQLLLFTTATLFLSHVGAIIMKLIMTKWSLDEDSKGDSLSDAGKYIGILERLFVFGFIILNQWQAIGLLIAAKSVFRFGDLTRAKDRKLTEYILIGTLLSFGIAIITGLCYQYALDNYL